MDNHFENQYNRLKYLYQKTAADLNTMIKRYKKLEKEFKKLKKEYDKLQRESKYLKKNK